jgi:hypothetical protein
VGAVAAGVVVAAVVSMAAAVESMTAEEDQGQPLVGSGEELTAFNYATFSKHTMQ